MMALGQDVDVLIVGAGPAGLMLATWLSKLKISTRIVDKRSTKVFTGQADGVQCRTVEVFAAFGFAERLVKEGAHINEVVFWNPTEEGGITRTKRTADNEPGTSRFPHAVLTQGRIERFMLDCMKEFNGLEVERAIQPTSLKVDSKVLTDPKAYPVTVTLRKLSEDESTPTQVGTVPNGLFRSNILTDDEADANLTVPHSNPGEEETIRAKYVVGCDGARSWVRKSIGLSLEGDSANAFWGVLDIVPLTNFPDIRLKCTIHSKDAGTILIVPRERDLVRFYVQLGSTAAGERVDRSKFTPESIMDKARAIMHPYKLESAMVDWWTIYEIGQRLCAKVHDETERVYIAGDAFHTHSPKAGQGMNVSMMDTFNLGWKLAAVLKGQVDPAILKTYQSERHQTAKELIELDYKLSRMFSGKPSEDAIAANGVSMEEFKKFFISVGRWASGTAAHYKPSMIVSKESGLAPKLPVGMRFQSVQVCSMFDARPWHLGDRLPADGRWRIVIFAGDVRQAAQKATLDQVANFLDSPAGPIRKFTPRDADIDSIIEPITIISNPRTSVEPDSFPDILWPAKAPYQCRDYSKIYADDETYFAGHGRAYESLQIDPKTGCLVIVRPDQYVSLVCGLDEYQQIGTFFSHFFKEPMEA